MKVIIAGSRSVTDIWHVYRAITYSGLEITEVVSGCARGVDKLGEEWALMQPIPIKRFPADWDFYGKSAGHKRNKQMAEYADALIAIWNGSSPGTKDMIEQATKRGLKVYILLVD